MRSCAPDVPSAMNTRDFVDFARSASTSFRAGNACQAFTKASRAIFKHVLAKEDGPWRSWWEAVPIAKSDQSFLVRWRDFPQVPNVSRSRWTLGLLYPNGR